MTLTTTFTLVASLALAAVFAIAGITKLGDRPGTREAVREFGAPVNLAPLLVARPPSRELAVAVVSSIPRNAGRRGSRCPWSPRAVLDRVAVTLARGGRRRIVTASGSCTRRRRAGRRSPETVSSGRCRRRSLLDRDTQSPPESRRGPGSQSGMPPSSMLIVALLVGVTLVVAAGFGFLAVTRSYGRVLLRLEATERALAKAGIEVEAASDMSMSELGLDPGTPAPAFSSQLSRWRVDHAGRVARAEASHFCSSSRAPGADRATPSYPRSPGGSASSAIA